MDSFFVSYIIIGAAIIASLKGFQDPDFLEKYMFIPYNIRHYKENYRFFSSSFLHGDFGHLIFNCITMYYFGQLLELFFRARYGFQIGNIIFFAFVILASVGSESISYARNQHNPNYRSLGLSGVTSAVVFATILLFPMGRIGIILLPIEMPAWIFGLIYLAFEIYSDRNRKTNIAHDAHIAGAIFGIIFILISNIDYVIAAFKTITI